MNFYENIYRIDIVMKAMMHKDLDYEIKSKFVKIMEIMFINREPFDHLKLPNFTRIWNEISLIGNRIQFYKGDLPDFIIRTKSFLVEYLKDTKGEQSIFDHEQNKMTLQIIRLVKLMVSYGFYRKKEELREISVTLISLLNGSCDIYDLRKNDISIKDDTNLNNFKRSKSNEVKTVITSRYQKTQDNSIIME